MPRPTDPISWNPPGAAVTTPSTARRNAGWGAEKPPYGIFNWFWALLTSWIAWLAAGQGYACVPDLIDDTEPGDTAAVTPEESRAVYETAFLHAPWSGTDDGAVGDLASSGRYVVFGQVQTAGGGTVTIGCLDAKTGTLLWSSTAPSALGPIAFDGRFIYAADGANCRVIDNDASVEGGSAVVVGTFASFTTRPFTLLAVQGPVLVAVEDNGSTGTVEGYLNPSDGSPSHVWSFSTDIGSAAGNDVNDITVGAARVFLAKDYGDTTSLVVLDLDTGTEINRADIDGNPAEAVATDGAGVWVGTASGGGGGGVFAVDINGAFPAVSLFSSVDIPSRVIAVDGDYLAWASSDLVILCPKNAAPGQSLNLFSWAVYGVHADRYRRLALDGGLLTIGGWRADGSPDRRALASYYLPRRTRHYRRVSYADTARPYPSLLVVPE